MNVLLLNGSPHPDGCTARALKEVSDTLEKEGIKCETIHVGNKAIRGCISCDRCKELHKCIFDDEVNEIAKKFASADGLVIGTPTYYAGANGTILALLDRLFHSSYIKKTMKVGAAVISSRRAGSTGALDEIYKYFGISNMPIATSDYWNEVHGFSAEDVEKDLEGLETMRTLGRNMAFMIKAINDAKEKYGLPENEKKVFTNFSDGL